MPEEILYRMAYNVSPIGSIRSERVTSDPMTILDALDAAADHVMKHGANIERFEFVRINTSEPKGE